jgi:hypothetical protein
MELILEACSKLVLLAMVAVVIGAPVLMYLYR